MTETTEKTNWNQNKKPDCWEETVLLLRMKQDVEKRKKKGESSTVFFFVCSCSVCVCVCCETCPKNKTAGAYMTPGSVPLLVC